LSIASPVVTASSNGAPVTGAPSIRFSVSMVASTACGVNASCGRCTGISAANRGSVYSRLKNSNRTGDCTSASWRSVT
jgi:hypothetical protein